jgi:hypothetical protein
LRKADAAGGTCPAIFRRRLPFLQSLMAMVSVAITLHRRLRLERPIGVGRRPDRGQRTGGEYSGTRDVS